MKTFEDLPIERKLLRMNLVTAGSALLLACLAFVTYDMVTFRTTLTQRLTAFADIVGANSASALLFNDAQAAERNLQALEARSNIDAAAIYNVKGEPFAHWVRPPGGFAFPVKVSGLKDQARLNSTSIDLFHPIYADRSLVGTVYIHADLNERTVRLIRYLLIALAVLFVSVGLSILISRPLGRRISQPLLDLVGVARRVSQEKNYAIRMQSTGGGEIRLLIDAFNQMLYQVQQRGEALLRAHSELERKVEERTAELRRKEEELHQSRRLESVGRLAGGVAHDFNNLLLGIIGCSETLESEIPADSPLAIEVQEIKRAGERASALTRQLLAFGRRQIIKPQPLNLNHVIQSTGKLLGRLIGEDINLMFDLDPQPDMIHADAGQMEQIVVNLAVNARDAMPKGGNLLIGTRNVKVGEEGEDIDLPPGQYVMLTIADTGQGMTRDVQAQIFEPFFTTKERGKGTGLGLATVYGIIKQNKGGVQVYSEPGFGSTFKVFMPKLENAADTPVGASSEKAETSVPSAHGETILLVEDEPLVANRLARVLRRKGYEVLVADHAQMAIDLMQQRGRAVDLVLTDVVMPGINGYQMVQTLLKTWPGLRALYMSGYPAEIIAQHGVLDPTIAFIEKPFYTDQICLKIREVLKR